MKTIKILIITLTLNLSMIAQDDNYKGLAKMDVKTFWRQADMFKNGKGSDATLGNMQKALVVVKEKDPSYNTAGMEEELKKWADKVNTDNTQAAGEDQKMKQDRDKKQDLLRRKVKISNTLDELYKFGSLTISGNDNKGDAWKAKIADFKMKADGAIAYKNDGGIIEGSYVDYIKKETLTTDKFIKQKRDALKEATESLTGVYYQVQLHLVYWEYALKLFPGIQEFIEAQSKTAKLAEEIGSLDDANGKVKANQQEAIKNTKLPTPVVKDAALEKVLIDGFNKTFSSKGATALKAVLTQEGWTTLRNPITSVITGRERSAKLAYKGSDGKCYLLEGYVFIHEEYIGGAFTNIKAVYNGLFGSEMLCENIK
ncbi:MAG: hypothetical protein SFY56_12565 [Bacteroidota bacterium]|nr:hypothetical protein [Bacteroidota bacterium]